MLDGYIFKTPEEKKVLTADFGSDILATDTIKTIGASSATKVVALDPLGADVSSVVISSTTISSLTLLITLMAGVDGSDYRIVATAEATTAHTITDKLYELRVRSGSKA